MNKNVTIEFLKIVIVFIELNLNPKDFGLCCNHKCLITMQNLCQLVAFQEKFARVKIFNHRILGTVSTLLSLLTCVCIVSELLHICSGSWLHFRNISKMCGLCLCTNQHARRKFRLYFIGTNWCTTSSIIKN